MEIIELSRRYNELVSKAIKGDLWFQDKSISEEEKKINEPRYLEMINELCKVADYLEMINIQFTELNINGLSIIELPDQYKRPKIEIWLENFSNHIKNKRSVS
jgi:hypothetical protein